MPSSCVSEDSCSVLTYNKKINLKKKKKGLTLVSSLLCLATRNIGGSKLSMETCLVIEVLV